MDPSRYSVVVLYQKESQPYRINDDDDNHNHNDDLPRPDYLPLLQSVFGRVSVRSNSIDALQDIKDSLTVCLIDLDTFHDHRHAIECIEEMARDCVVITVCSLTEDFDFMLKCINAGAVDYLLKPLRLDVIKTLFLKAVHRNHADKNIASPATTSTSDTPITPTTPVVNHCSGLHHRIKEITANDTALAKAILDIYAPTTRPPFPMTQLSSQRADHLLGKVSSWDFCPYDFDNEEQIHCAYLIFEQALSCTQMPENSISQKQLYNVILDLAGSYRNDNPYHNFAHAVDVLQCSYYFLRKLGVLPYHANVTGPQGLLRPIDIFALLVAALGHDTAHPGVNNLFLINSATPLAILYNDRSVLESFHSMTLFQLLKKHGIDRALGGCSSQTFQEFRKTIVASILATDMSLHNDYVAKIKDQATRKSSLSSLDGQAREQERLLLCSALIKCADISNVTRPFRRAVKWAELLAQEFILQGDIERELGMPVQPMNDRDKLNLEDMQIGFIKFVASDLFKAVANVIHEMTFTVESLQQNLKQWEHRKQSDSWQVVEEKTKETEHLAHAVVPTDNAACNGAKPDKSFNGLPQMPTIAMTNYGSPAPSPSTPINENIPPEWAVSTPSSGGAYCQCILM